MSILSARREFGVPTFRPRRLLVGAATLTALLTALSCGSTPTPVTPAPGPGASSAASSAKFSQPDVWVESESQSSPGADIPPDGDDSHAVEGDANQFVVGPVRLRLGARPPWSELREPPPQLPADVNSKWRLTATIEVGKGYLHKAEFSHDAQSVFVLSQEDGILRQYDAATGRSLAQMPLERFVEFEDADFAPRPDADVFLFRNSGLQTVNPKSGVFSPLAGFSGGDTLHETLRSGLYAFSTRRVSPQSGEVTLAWMDGTALRDSTTQPELALQLDCAERPDAVALSPDGRLLALDLYPSDQVRVIDLQAKRELFILEPPKWAGNVAFSPDGSLIVLGGAELHVHDARSGALLARDAQYGNNIGNVRFTPQGDLLLTAAFDGKARSYKLTPGAPFTGLPKPQLLRHRGTANVYGLGLSGDGRKLATSSGDKSVKLWAR